MKKFALYLLLILMLSCSQKDEELCRTWVVSDVRFQHIEKALVQSDTINGDELRIRMMLLREALMKNVYAFQSDGTYKTGNAAASSEGKWDLRGNDIVFISDEPESKPKRFKMEHLSQDSLVLNMQNDQTSVSVVLLLTPVANAD